MFPFIETIRIEGGHICHLSYHNRRMNETRREKIQADIESLDLSAFIRPEAFRERTKCRVEYAADILKVEYADYRLRPVSSLRLVVCDTVDYRYKSTDRGLLNRLFALREEADDVLIVRDGLLTDTSICNIALWDGNRWVTPAHPLLAGTQRASLLDRGEIVPGGIRSEDLPDYSRIRLFNAMIDFGEIDFPIERISD